MLPNQVIETKADTPEKLAAAQGKATKNFLFASEINTISGLVKTLWSLTTVNPNTIAPNYKKVLGIIEGMTFIEKINSSAATSYLSPSYVLYIQDGVTYIQSFIGAAGSYGTGALQANESMFILLETSEGEEIVQKTKIFKAIVNKTNITILTDDVGLISYSYYMGTCTFSFPDVLLDAKTFLKPVGILTSNEGTFGQLSSVLNISISKTLNSIQLVPLDWGSQTLINDNMYFEFELFP
jgi:hypothetical protein